MARWREMLPGLLIAGLVACGGAPAATISQAVTSSTATAGPASAPSAPGGSAAPVATVTGATAAAPGTAPTKAPTKASAAVPTTATATTAVEDPGETPTPTRDPGAARGPQPGGVVPAGWKIHYGPPAFPIVIAYPPDWRVDTSLFPDQAVIFIIGPEGESDGEMVEIVIGAQAFDANIDVLRDDFFYRKTDFCEKTGIEYTTRRQISSATFALLGATCDSSNTLTFIQAASGLKGGDEWDFAMRTPYERKEKILKTVFDPMLASINIYALIQP